MLRAPFNKLVVENHEIETTLGDFMIDPDGRDTTIEATVIAKGNNITDVEVGDVITYPKSRGIAAMIGDQEIRVVDYQSMLYYQTQNTNE